MTVVMYLDDWKQLESITLQFVGDFDVAQLESKNVAGETLKRSANL